jgi:hypothetical protein
VPFPLQLLRAMEINRRTILKEEPKKHVKEIARIDEPFVFFADDESLVDSKRMDTLARLLKEAGIKRSIFSTAGVTPLQDIRMWLNAL